MNSQPPIPNLSDQPCTTGPDTFASKAQRAGFILAQTGAVGAGLGTRSQKNPLRPTTPTSSTPVIRSGTHRANPAPSWFGVPPSGGAFVTTQTLPRTQSTTRQTFFTHEAQRAGLILAQTGAVGAGLGTRSQKNPLRPTTPTSSTPVIRSGTHRVNLAPSWFGVPPSGGAFVTTQTLPRTQSTTRQTFSTPEAQRAGLILAQAAAAGEGLGTRPRKTIKA